MHEPATRHTETAAVGRPRDALAQFAATASTTTAKRFLNRPYEIAAQLTEVTTRIRDRHERITALLVDQGEDQRLEHKLTDDLRNALADATNDHADEEAQWGTKVESAVTDSNNRWSQRLEVVERALQSEQTKHHCEVAELQRDWLEAVTKIRKLEAALDLQRSAADVVIQNASAVHDFLKNNDTLHPVGNHGNTATTSATTATAGEASQQHLTANTTTATPGRSVSKDTHDSDTHYRPGHETPSGQASMQVSPQKRPFFSVPQDEPNPLEETSRPSATAAERVAEAFASGRSPSPQADAPVLQTHRRSNSAGVQPMRLDSFDAAPQQPSYRSASQGQQSILTSVPNSARSTASQRARSVSPPLNWMSLDNGTRAATGYAYDGPRVAPSHDCTIGLVLGLRRQDCHLLGVEVVRVIPGSPAHLAGIRPRSLLVELNGRPITSSQDVQHVLLEVKRAEHLRRRSGGLAPSHVLVPFQCIDLPRHHLAGTYLDDMEGSSKSELELDDGRRLSWEGHIRIDVSRLAVGPFNQHREHFVGSPTDLAPVTEVIAPADALYW